MIEIDPFEVFKFKDTEKNIYKQLIQLTKVSPQKYNKINASDLVQMSKYSKPKVYEAIKKLEEYKLIHIIGYRPMVIEVYDPKYAIEKMISDRTGILEKAGEKIIDDLYSLPHIEPKYPLRDTIPFSFFNRIDVYFSRLEYLLEHAEKKVIIICGFLIKNEEIILKDYLNKIFTKKPSLEIRILYGGSFYDIQKKENNRFRSFFKRNVIDPNKQILDKFTENCFIDGAIVNAPLRYSIIDDSEVLMALKTDDKKDNRIGLTDISGFQSSNKSFVRFLSDTYIMLKRIFIEILRRAEDMNKFIEEMNKFIPFD